MNEEPVAVNQIAVNQRKSMPNDTAESWSVPWHTLQKTLADAFGCNAPVHPLAAPKRASSSAKAVAGNWLVKARGLWPPAAVDAR